MKDGIITYVRDSTVMCKSEREIIRINMRGCTILKTGKSIRMNMGNSIMLNRERV